MRGWLPEGLRAYGAELGAAAAARLGSEIVGDAWSWIEMGHPSAATEDGAPPPETNEPVMWRDGALCVDLGPDDTETWERFAEVMQHEPDPEAVAVAAQEWRLAVTPYRRLGEARSAADAHLEAAHGPAASPGETSSADVASPGIAVADIAGATVIDLTSMWAGPLCTELLGRAGASVTKITSATRPDGLAGAAMFADLNRHKHEAELDLRRPAARARLDEMLREADLAVTSLSPRALANLGLGACQLAGTHPRLRTLAVTAFEPHTPEDGWIAYGTGVHAASGLGWQCPQPHVPGRHALGPRAPAFSYPDPLAGLAAAAAAADQLANPEPTHRRISLAGAIAPLVLVAPAAVGAAEHANGRAQ